MNPVSEFREFTRKNVLAHLLHKGSKPSQIVNRRQSHAQDFIGSKKMMQVRSRKRPAGITRARGIYWIHVVTIPPIGNPNTPR